MTYDKEEQGDENEFVHFEEEELGGDPEEIIEEESEEELVISERPGAAASPQPPLAAPKPAAKKKAPAKKAKKRAKKAKKKAKAAPKKAAKKEDGQEDRQARQEALTVFRAQTICRTEIANKGPGSFLRAFALFWRSVPAMFHSGASR